MMTHHYGRTLLARCIGIALLLIATASAFSLGSLGSLFPGNKNAFVQPKHAPGVKVADYARHDLPRIRMGERTIDLTSGVNFVSVKLNMPATIIVEFAEPNE